MDQRGHLQAWFDFIRRDSHKLDYQPVLFFQQAANQPDSSVPAQMALIRYNSGREKRPWLRWINKPQHHDLCLMTLIGHEGAVNSVAFSPNGRYIVSGSYDRTLKVWDAASGKEINSLSGHKKSISSCAFSPDGKQIVSASLDKTLIIWDAATGGKIAILEGHNCGIIKCSYSPEGKRIVSVGGQDNHEGNPNGEIKIWDIRTRKEIAALIGHQATVNCCSFSSDGTRIITSSNDLTLKLWDAISGKEVASFSDAPYRITTCHFLAGRNKILVHPQANPGITFYANDPETQTLTDKKTGLEFLQIPIPGNKGSVCSISNDGASFVVGKLKDLSLWDLKNKREIAKLRGHTDLVLSCSFSPDKKWLVSSSKDNTIKIWDASGDGLIQEPLEKNELEGDYCHFMPDGKSLITLKGSNLNVRETQTGNQISTVNLTLESKQRFTNDFCVSPNGKMILIYERHALKLIDIWSGLELAKIKLSSYCERMGFSIDGRTIFAIDGFREFVKFWDINSGEEISFLYGPGNSIYNQIFSLDNEWKVFLTSNEMKSWDGLRFYEIAALSGHEERISCCPLSPDGKTILFKLRSLDDSNKKSNGFIMLWDSEIKKQILIIPFHGYQGIFSPDGNQFVSISHGKLIMWDAHIGKELSFKSEYLGRVNELSFSPDGSCLATISAEIGMRLHDARTGKIQCEYIHFGTSYNIEWSPDSNYIIFGEHWFEVMGVEHFAPMVTAWRSKFDDTFAIGCPFCRLWSEIEKAELNRVLSCPNCNKMIQINPFIINSDWRQMADAWKKKE